MSLFITFEGLDGAGKTTQIQRLRQHLETTGRAVVCTREPGGTDLGDEIRTLLLEPRQSVPSPRTEALLYAASRAQLLHEVIVPALRRGVVVLCDRYVDASLAYQGEGLGLGVDAVDTVNRFATQGLRPHRTFLFDLAVEISQDRVQRSRAHVGPDRIERRDADYFERVRERFLAIAAAEPDRVVTLDATQSADALQQEIQASVANLLRT